MSPCGFLGAACIISFLSTSLRQLIYSAVYQSPLPEDLKSHGQRTFGMITAYGLALAIDKQYVPVAVPLIACHVLLEQDVCEAFRCMIRPKIITIALRSSTEQVSAELMNNSAVKVNPGSLMTLLIRSTVETTTLFADPIRAHKQSSRLYTDICIIKRLLLLIVTALSLLNIDNAHAL